MATVRKQMIALAVCEWLLACLAVHLAALLRFAGAAYEDERSFASVLMQAAVFGATVVTMFTAMGLYQERQRLKIEGVLIRVVLALALAAVGLGLIYYVVPVLLIGRGWFAVSIGVSVLLLGASRAAFAAIVDQDLFRRRVVVYGTGRSAGSVLALRRRSDQRGFRVLAFLPVPGEPDVIADERIDRSSDDLLAVAKKHQADEVVIAMDDRRRSFPIRALLDCKLAGIDVIEVMTFLERESGKLNVDLMSPSFMIFADGFTRRRAIAFAPRFFDIAASVALLAVSWPLFLATALAILIEDGRPVLYRQTRVGLLGKPFELLKFRSMRTDAEKDGAQWATLNDSRVTRVGKWIRKLRIDELPQLFNIIRGDMRFIGPRPERPDFVGKLAESLPYYHERHSVKPGLTGWAQLCYPYGSTEKDALEKLKFDLYYVKNQSFVFDLMILLQTVEVVFWGKGAR